MNKKGLCIFLFVAFILVGCGGNDIQTTGVWTSLPASSATRVPTLPVTATQLAPLPEASDTPSESVIPTVTRSGTPSIPPESQLKIHCLEVVPKPPQLELSSGIVVMENLESVIGRSYPDTFLLNMATGQNIQIAMPEELLRAFSVSPDRKQVAFSSVIFDSEGKIINRELVIVNADGQRQISIPWEQEWAKVTDWLDNQHLLIPLAGLDPNDLVMDPFTGERQVLHADFPRFLTTPPLTRLSPFWYDPTLSLAVYPRYSRQDEERYSYGLWDLKKQSLVTSLETIFELPTGSDIYPIPKWFTDGSKFIFKGLFDTPDQLIFELYLVDKDGQIEQLTHLTSTAHIWENSYTWSPDGKNIALFLGPPGGAFYAQARTAVLNTKTLEVTDYCISLNHSGVGYGVGPPPLPIWSPDGKQFLVVNRYDKEHQNVILVDIEKGIAAVIAEDMEPVGWMVLP